MKHKRVYKTHFKFDRYVRSIREANEFFDDENGWAWVKEDVADWIGKDEADKIIDLTWCMVDRECGCIRAVTTEELSDNALEVLSRWIKRRCNSLEEDIFDFTDAFYYNIFWGSPIEYDRNDGWVRVHFDHDGSDYKLKLVKAQ